MWYMPNGGKLIEKRIPRSYGHQFNGYIETGAVLIRADGSGDSRFVAIDPRNDEVTPGDRQALMDLRNSLYGVRTGAFDGVGLAAGIARTLRDIPSHNFWHQRDVPGLQAKVDRSVSGLLDIADEDVYRTEESLTHVIEELGSRLVESEVYITYREIRFDSNPIYPAKLAGLAVVRVANGSGTGIDSVGIEPVVLTPATQPTVPSLLPENVLVRDTLYRAA